LASVTVAVTETVTPAQGFGGGGGGGGVLSPPLLQEKYIPPRILMYSKECTKFFLI
jgi:hypothetical protein